MLKARQIWAIALLLGLASGLAWLDSSPHPPHENAISAAQSHAANAPQQQQPAKTLGERFTIIWNRTWDDPVAFYTFVLSIFTGLLAIVSAIQIGFLIRSDKTARIAAEAASLNAKAAVAVELPILAPISIALHREPGVIGRVDMPGPISTLRINFKNWGRTHAELISQYVEWLVAAKLPEIPIYKTELAFPPGTFVESGKNLRDAPQDFIINIQPDEVEAIAKEEKFLWVYGYLSFNDFLGNPHQHRWCASWGAYQLPNGATAHGFIYDLKTPPDYIKRT
jgi:hypothetical protein